MARHKMLLPFGQHTMISHAPFAFNPKLLCLSLSVKITQLGLENEGWRVWSGLFTQPFQRSSGSDP